jgi:tetratricopeptide (TPR) repeat protein
MSGIHMLRRALLVVFLLPMLACQEAPELPPIVLSDPRGLDAEVLELVATKVEAVRAAPTSAGSRASLGLVYEANGIWDLGAASFAQAAALDERQPLYRYHEALCLREAGETDKALATMKAAARRLENQAGVQQRLGQWLLELGEYEEARQCFERALARMPDHSDVLAGLASVEVERQRWNEAQSLAKRSLKVDPSNRSARYALGMALRGLGREEEARAQLTAGQGAKPRWIEEPLTREFLSYRLTTSGLMEDAAAAAAGGNHGRAAELYSVVARRQPDDATLKNNWAASLTELGRYEESERVLKEALALDPGLFAVELNLCDLYTRMNQLEPARVHGEKAVALGADVGRTHLALARVVALQGDYARAYAQLELSVGLDARNVQAYVALTETAVRLRRFADARNWCRKVLELDSGHVPTRVNLALLSIQENDLEEAKRQLLECEKQAPEMPKVKAIREELKRRGVL